MATIPHLEAAARADWARWGTGYAMFTACSCCGGFLWCRGRRRDWILCLDCYDVTGGKR